LPFKDAVSFAGYKCGDGGRDAFDILGVCEIGNCRERRRDEREDGEQREKGDARRNDADIIMMGFFPCALRDQPPVRQSKLPRTLRVALCKIMLIFFDA